MLSPISGVHMNNIKFFSSAAVAIVAPMALLGILVCVVIVTLPLYRQTVATLPKPHVTVADSDVVARSVIMYVFFSKPLAADSFSTSEQRHLQDIRSLSLKVATIFAALLVAFLISAIHLRNADRRLLYRSVATSFAVVAVIGVLLAYFIRSYFDLLFEYFHKVTFRSGNWQFDPTTEKLIVVFPPQLFFAVSLAVLTALIIFSAVLSVYFYSRYKRL